MSYNSFGKRRKPCFLLFYVRFYPEALSEKVRELILRVWSSYGNLSRMLKIRLQRVGRKNIPSFRVVLTESKNGPRSGKSLEILGIYDPVNDVKEIKADRIKYWIGQGVQLSGTVNNFLVDKGVITGEKKSVTSRRKVVKTEEAKGETPKTADVPAEPKETKTEPASVAEAKIETVSPASAPSDTKTEKTEERTVA